MNPKTYRVEVFSQGKRIGECLVECDNALSACNLAEQSVNKTGKLCLTYEAREVVA